MTREEAIQIIRETYHTDEEMKALESLIPELRESEDERTRKRTIAILKQQRDYWNYDGSIDKFPPATPRKDLVDAIDVALLYLEKQKEQKPAEKQDYSELNDLERAILRGFLCAGVKNVPIGIIKDTASECMGFLALIEPKPAEWSEEDDRVFEFAIARVEIYERDFLHGNNEMSERLKALHPRPSWKPSEEQMEALDRCVDYLDESDNEDAGIIESLYEQLKKLKP